MAIEKKEKKEENHKTRCRCRNSDIERVSLVCIIIAIIQ